jgi:hypothetical protein
MKARTYQDLIVGRWNKLYDVAHPNKVDIVLESFESLFRVNPELLNEFQLIVNKVKNDYRESLANRVTPLEQSNSEDFVKELLVKRIRRNEFLKYKEALVNSIGGLLNKYHLW